MPLDIAEAKQQLEAKKNALAYEAALIQTALDALDEKIAVAFPNLDVVVADKASLTLELDQERLNSQRLFANNMTLQETLTEKDARITELLTQIPS